MPLTTSGAAEFLQQIYEDLHLTEGLLFPPSTLPTVDTADSWQAIGDWLSLAERMNADHIFFVGDDPVIVFSTVPDDASEHELIQTYRKAWSLARPRCLFLASSDELKVYDLSVPPPQDTEQWQRLPLQVLERTANVAESLSAYQRDRIESGQIFDDNLFAGVDRRADKQLLSDIDVIAQCLRDAGLPARLAHALIERVILIRYLEDREVITPDYIAAIAGTDSASQDASADHDDPIIFGANSEFVKCLLDRNLTYQIFHRLAEEFNGDLFLVDEIEHNATTGEHLELLFRLLTGDADPFQRKLFLWAYDFSVVPISLISSMYEHFYHATQEDDSDLRGTHYTPPELVEYVLSKVLTPELLDLEPRILDPACGSGTFLVEAYRAIVRHEVIRTGGRLTPKRLRENLLTRIAGIDLNDDAIRLSAFSLYLAYLNYQSPQDIRQSRPLPRLIYHRDAAPFAPLMVNDFFAQTVSELGETLLDTKSPQLATLPWPSNSFDVVVGNPPWTSPAQGTEDRAESWANSQKLPIGDRSPSQLFLWRALNMLKPEGHAAMLVASTVLYNTNSKSRAFRRSWLGRINIEELVNFTQARHLFFTHAVAPFCLIKFRLSREGDGLTPFVHLTVRPSNALKMTRAMAYGHVDRRLVRQDSARRRDYLWKVYAWGSHHDQALMERLDQETPLRSILPTHGFKGGYGYQFGTSEPSEVLRTLRSLRRFEPWGPIDPSWLEPPPRGVKRQPNALLYRGQRLLVGRGVKVGFGPYARLEDSALTFRHHIYGIPLTVLAPWQAKVVFGTVLSSLGRYRLFMSSGAWAVWHDSIVSEDLLRLPIRLGSQDDPTVIAICNLVDEIRSWSRPELVFGSDDSEPTELLRRLDRRVFELFDLTASEADLIDDWSQFSLDFETAGSKPIVSAALSTTVFSELASPLSDYVNVFVEQWNRKLGSSASLSWQILGSEANLTIAAVFRAVEKSASLSHEGFENGMDDIERWMAAIGRLGASMPSDMGRQITTEGIVRVIGGDYFMIVKRNEQRLWSASAAREDFEATLLSAMRLRVS